MQHRYFGAFHFLRAICVHISYTNTIFEVEMHEQSVSLLVKRSPHKYYSASAYSFFFFFCHWYQIFRLLHFIQDFNNWEATGECHASCSMFSYGWIYTSRTWQKVCAYCFLRSLKKALNGACLTEVSHFHLFALSPISSHPTVTAMRYADCQTCESVVPVLPVQVVTCIALQCMADLRQSSFLCVVTLHLERVIL